MKLPIDIVCSFTITPGGIVDEVTWSTEDKVLRALKELHPDDEARTLRNRWYLRRMSEAGYIVARRNPEHGYWEYGPQWRRKGFSLAVAEAVDRLTGLARKRDA